MLAKTLEEIEKEILKKVDVFKAACIAFQEAESNLRKEVQTYQKERERLQKESWMKENLGWCQICDKFCPQESIRLFYTEGREQHTKSYGLYKRVRTFCEDCAEIILSRPRGGEEEFQCYKAKQEKDGFVIFVSGQWIPIPEPEYTQIEIEREYITEGEYRFGKLIECPIWPSLHLRIGGKEIL